MRTKCPHCGYDIVREMEVAGSYFWVCGNNHMDEDSEHG